MKSVVYMVTRYGTKHTNNTFCNSSSWLTSFDQQRFHNDLLRSMDVTRLEWSWGAPLKSGKPYQREGPLSTQLHNPTVLTCISKFHTYLQTAVVSFMHRWNWIAGSTTLYTVYYDVCGMILWIKVVARAHDMNIDRVCDIHSTPLPQLLLLYLYFFLLGKFST